MMTCTGCGIDVIGARARCAHCGSPVGEEDHQPDVYIVRDLVGEPDDWESHRLRELGFPVEEAPVQVVSAWLSGPSSFGPLGRLMFTLVVLVVGYVMYLGALSVGGFYGQAGLALIMLLIGCFTVLAILLLWGVWRPTRVK